jgi:hypothetical protein
MKKRHGPTRREMLLSVAASIAASSKTTYSSSSSAKEGTTLKQEQASQFAKLALTGIQKEYPNKAEGADRLG